MAYQDILNAHRRLSPDQALALNPMLSNLLEGRLSREATFEYLRTLQLEAGFEQGVRASSLGE